MNKKHFLLACAAIFSFQAFSSSAQTMSLLGPPKPQPIQKVYLSTNLDGYILSSSLLEKAPATEAKLTTPRLSGFLHMGFIANFDFTRSFGIYSGLNIKNIGFIEKYSVVDSTVKRRVYTFGIPVGIKIGKIDYGNYVMLGGGVDFPFNYKEKGFVDRNDKDKFNEWFSDRTPAVMPYVFVGAHLRPGVAFKLQYYPTNFLNTDFVEMNKTIATLPYKDYNVNLCLLTLGFDINYRPKEMHKKK